MTSLSLELKHMAPPLFVRDQKITPSCLSRDVSSESYYNKDSSLSVDQKTSKSCVRGNRFGPLGSPAVMTLGK
jgi:hypothetical protein